MRQDNPCASALAITSSTSSPRAKARSARSTALFHANRGWETSQRSTSSTSKVAGAVGDGAGSGAGIPTVSRGLVKVASVLRDWARAARRAERDGRSPRTSWIRAASSS